MQTRKKHEKIFFFSISTYYSSKTTKATEPKFCP